MGKQPASFLSMDTEGRVIRLDSFSKIMSAGIRLGAVTAHKDIIKHLVIQMENTILHASSLSQVSFTKIYFFGNYSWKKKLIRYKISRSIPQKNWISCYKFLRTRKFFSQMLTLQLFENWSPEKFEQHFKEIQSFYRQKRDLMLAAVEKHLTGWFPDLCKILVTHIFDDANFDMIYS